MAEKIEAGTVNIIQQPAKKREVEKPKPKSKATATVKKAGKVTVKRVKKIGEIGAVKTKGVLNNIKANANKTLLKTLAFGAVGAISYPLVPTVIQAITKSDMSGWRGLLTGVATVSVVGLAVGKPEMLVGAGAAMGTHLLYAKGTQMIENATGTQIFRMNPNNQIYREDLQNAIQGGTLSDDDATVDNPVAIDNELNFDEMPEPNVLISKMLAACNKESCKDGCICQDDLTIGKLLTAEQSETVGTPQETETVEAVPLQSDQTNENQLNDLSFRRNNNTQQIFYKYY
jgi:hypothetical protein